MFSVLSDGTANVSWASSGWGGASRLTFPVPSDKTLNETKKELIEKRARVFGER